MDIILNKLPDDYKENKTLWVYEDNIPLYEKYNQFETIKSETKQAKEIKNETKTNEMKTSEMKNETKTSEIKSETKTNEMKQTPINIIINQTFTANVMKNEVKQRLIDFITEPEFSKAFGAKKAGEIVSAILRDSWNQSTALFLSFLLDANVIYKDKSYLYNKDKNKIEIMIK